MSLDGCTLKTNGVDAPDTLGSSGSVQPRDLTVHGRLVGFSSVPRRPYRVKSPVVV